MNKDKIQRTVILTVFWDVFLKCFTKRDSISQLMITLDFRRKRLLVLLSAVEVHQDVNNAIQSLTVLIWSSLQYGEFPATAGNHTVIVRDDSPPLALIVGKLPCGSWQGRILASRLPFSDKELLRTDKQLQKNDLPDRTVQRYRGGGGGWITVFCVHDISDRTDTVTDKNVTGLNNNSKR